MNKLNLSYAQREASRCLLCYDPPCSKACPGNFNPGRIIRAV
ncbi:MAG: oxidoreductase YeiT, partial [Halanaerobiaceae bacterium]